MSKYNPLNENIKSFDYKQFLNIDLVKEQSSIADNIGIPTTNRFACLLNCPPGHTEFKLNGWLEFQVLEVDCPNVSLQEGSPLELNGVKRYYFMGRNDNDLSITFLETPDLLLRRFFYSWMQMAVDVSEYGVVRNYLEEYTANDITVFPLDFKGAGYVADKFVNVFPYDINSINYNYNRAGDIVKTTVKFKSMFHHIVKLEDSDQYHWASQIKIK